MSRTIRTIIHVTVLQDENTVLGTMSYRDLQTAARAVAQGLISRDIVPGDRIAMMLPTSTDFFASFFGILYAGAVPVPIYPPARMAQLEEHMRRQIVILRNAGARMLITVPEGRELAVLLRSQVETLEVGRDRHDAVGGALRSCRCRRSNDPEALGLMQYTSGSTGDPKGVMLTHWGLLENVRSMGHAMEATSNDVFVSWLPLYHDMGLIGAWLGCCYFGARLYVMSPISFLVRPATWLWTMHKYRATFSGGPNFAFELCASRIPDERPAGARPLGAALHRQRRRADLAADPAPVHRPLRALRHGPRRALAELRARGELRRPVLPAARARPADRPHQARVAGQARLRGAGRAGRYRRDRDGRLRPSDREERRAHRRRRRAASSASARRACWNSAGPR